MTADAEVLHLDDDYETHCFLADVENAFSIELEQADMAGVETLGQLFVAIEVKLGEPTQPRACFSSYVFYELRRAINQKLPCRRVAPGLKLLSFTRQRGNQRLWRELQKSLSYRLPVLESGFLFHSAIMLFIKMLVLLLLIMVLNLFLFTAPNLLFYLIFSIITVSFAFSIIICRWPGDLPRAAGLTVASLVEDITARNFGDLARRLGGYRRDDAWRSFLHIAQEFADPPDKPLGCDTRLWS